MALQAIQKTSPSEEDRAPIHSSLRGDAAKYTGIKNTRRDSWRVFYVATILRGHHLPGAASVGGGGGYCCAGAVAGLDHCGKPSGVVLPLAVPQELRCLAVVLVQEQALCWQRRVLFYRSYPACEPLQA